MKPKNILYVIVTILIAFQSITIEAQTLAEKSKITKNYNQTYLKQLQNRLYQKSIQEKQYALQQAKIYGWETSIIKPNGTFLELMKVVDGKPIYYTTFNADAAISTRANFLHNGGGLGLNLEGQGMTAFVWDGGHARVTHQEYDGIGGTDRVSIGDSPLDPNFHSAHVTGTIVASGFEANAKGMAPQAFAVSYQWDSDLSEATTEANAGMLVSNHSYGYVASGIPDDWFGQYGSDAHDWDDIMYNASNYLMIVAAGNDGNDNSSNAVPLDGNSSYDKLSGHATAKNNLVVANAEDASIDTASGNLISVSINSSSSEGPTDDYRIKPDITGNGTGLYSTYETADDIYASITGTSMASPNVTGSLLLLQQHYNNLNSSFMRAATLKGLALHTADDAGISGPDAIFGWGLLNTKKAAETITQKDNESIIEEFNLTSGNTFTMDVDSDGVNTLIASISWTDPAGIVNTATNSSTPALVNDLDIRITQNANTYFPYRLTSITTNSTGDNLVDPYERVDVASASGTYTITVTHKGTLSSTQAYTLIVTGITYSGTCTATVPTNVQASVVEPTSALIIWDFVQGADYEIQYREVGSSTWITDTATSSSYTITGLTPDTDYEVQVRSVCPDTTTSTYSSPVTTFTTPIPVLCDSSGTTEWATGTTYVELNTISNATPTKTAGYNDYTAISTDLEQGAIYDLSTRVDTDGDFAVGTMVWIDWNQDADFDDDGEEFNLGYAVNVSDGATTNSPLAIAVPDTAVLGNTIMRVSTKFGAYATACENYFDGEVEDYTINVVTCGSTTSTATPTNVQATLIDATSATITWDAISGVNYRLRYREVGAVTWIEAVTTTNSYQITGLITATDYEAQVQSVVCASSNSDYSDSVYFTTLSCSHCASVATASTRGTTLVDFNTINNTTAATSGYSDFTAQSTDVTRLVAYDLTVNVTTGTQNRTGYTTVWIDWNQDCDFDDAGEEYNLGITPRQVDQATSNSPLSITVPADALIGNTIMRVSTKMQLASTSCENAFEGEVEDYTLNILSASPCSGATTTWDGSAWDNGTPDATMPAIIDGAYDTTTNGNIICCNLTINASASINVSAGQYISIGYDFVNNGAIVVEHEGSLVQTDDTSSVSGIGTYQIKKKTTLYAEYDYTYWSSPTSGETIEDVFNTNSTLSEGSSTNNDDFSPTNHIYKLDTAAFSDENDDTFDDDGNDWLVATGPMTVGKGYIAMGAGSDFPFDAAARATGLEQSIFFEGTVNNGTIDIPVVLDLYNQSNSTGHDNYNNSANLIGNPYPSAIDIHLLMSLNPVILQGDFYFWTHDSAISSSNPGPDAFNFTNDDYSILTVDAASGITSSTNGSNGTSANKYIASGQGFLANVTTTGNVSFTNAMRVTGNNNTLLGTETTIDRLWLNLTKEESSVFRQILVGFYEGATDTYQAGQDGQRIENGANTDFYSTINEDNRHFAIQNLSFFNNTKTINLGLEIVEAGIYKIDIDHFEGIFTEGQAIYLEDIYENIIHNFTNGGYVFSTEIGVAIEDRFILRFINETLSFENEIFNSLTIYPNPSSNIFTISFQSSEKLSIEVFDLTGKVILNRFTDNQIDLTGYAKGIYFVKLSIDDVQTVKKLVLK